MRVADIWLQLSACCMLVLLLVKLVVTMSCSLFVLFLNSIIKAGRKDMS